MSSQSPTPFFFLPKPRLDTLLDALRADGFEVIGPRLEQGVIVYAPLTTAAQLPIGWTDVQSAGTYRVEPRSDGAYFGYALGPHSWKRYLFPPSVQLWNAQREGRGFTVHEPSPDPPRRALLGVRACELHALAIQDKIFLRRGGVSDPYYAAARQRLRLIAVECTLAGATCFCASMGTGPALADGLSCDLALTEIDDGFVIRSASPEGELLLQPLRLQSAAAAQIESARRGVQGASESMRRHVDASQVRELLHGNQEHPRWDDVAARCLACANCTMVCPTCFCSSVTDTTSLDLKMAGRERQWDSCFNPEFAAVHGGNFRVSVRARYRQWLTHKFASWYDQFDTSGCVGCGRCITWCPVGIDVTEEIAAIAAASAAAKEAIP